MRYDLGIIDKIVWWASVAVGKMPKASAATVDAQHIVCAPAGVYRWILVSNVMFLTRIQLTQTCQPYQTHRDNRLLDDHPLDLRDSSFFNSFEASLPRAAKRCSMHSLKIRSIDFPLSAERIFNFAWASSLSLAVIFFIPGSTLLQYRQYGKESL